jgi:hypothetical protein
MRRPLIIYCMTLQLLTSEFPYMRKIFFFFSVLIPSRVVFFGVCTVHSVQVLGCSLVQESVHR